MSQGDGIVRAHRPGHIGDTPQDTSRILAGAREAGALQAFLEHEPPHARVDAIMGYPNVAAEPGYLRDDRTALVLMDAASRMDPSVMRTVPTGKTLGGYDPNDPNP